MTAKSLIGLSVFLLVLLGLRIFFFYALPLSLKNGQELNFETTLLADPTVLGNYQYMQVTAGDFWHTALIRVKAKQNPQYTYGDTLKIFGVLTSSSYNNQKEWILKASKIELLPQGFLPFFGKIRSHIITLSGQSFSQEYSGLLQGILLGVKKNLSMEQIIAMRNVGFSHFMVIDGMKITLFVSYVVAFLGALFRKKTAIILSLIFVGTYMVLSGLEVSALRAGIMAILALSAQLWGRQYTGLYSLCLTSGFLLLWDPLLLENIGFQLSVLSTAGIILIKPLIPLKGLFWDGVSITLSAQIATMPILLTTFGNYGLLSVPAHVLVLWAIPLIMIVNGTGIILSFLFVPLGILIMQLSLPLLWYFQAVFLYFGNFNWNLQVSTLPAALTLGYYLMIIALILFLRNHRQNHVVLLKTNCTG